MRKLKSIAMSLFMAVLMLGTGLVLSNSDDTEVSANQASTADDEGYTWIDSQGTNPSVSYDWIDATGGTAQRTKLAYSYSYYGVYYRMPTSQGIPLPFTFNFYGNDFDEIYLWPNGMASFDANSPSGYNYRNYGGALPDSHSTTPGNLIAALWTYGGIKTSGDSNIYTLSGTTTEGVDYFVIEWHNMITPYYYAGGSYGNWNSFTMTFEAILYETGEIKVQWQDITGGSSYSNGRYADCGIQNADRDVGVNYHHRTYSGGTDRIRAGHAVVFKQFRTEIRNATVKPGFGVEENIYPAQAGQGEEYYWARADFWIETDVENMLTMDLVIDADSQGERIKLRYDFETDQFMNMDGPNSLVMFNEAGCAMMLDTQDPDHMGTVLFEFDFDFSWPTSDLISLEWIIDGEGVKGSSLYLDGVFRVVTQVQMEGNITVLDVKGRELERGDYVKGGDYITVTGIERAYADPEIPIQPPDMIAIGIRDSKGRFHQCDDTGDLVDLKILVEDYYTDMELVLEFINVSANNDMSDHYYKGWRFLVLVDNDDPGLPGEIKVKPDSKEDLPRNYDDDRDVFVTWKDAVDQSSGVAMYHISVNKDKEEAYATGSEVMDVIKGTYTAEVKGLSEGTNKIYIWAEDAVGNEGNSIFAEVMIDLTQVYFSDFYPETGEWINILRPTCSILVHDDLTGVDPLTIQYEISTSGEVGLIGDWQQIIESYAPGAELRVVVSGWFKNGMDNWIRFRARDVAGNPFFESEPYNVWVDAKPPSFKLLSHSEDEYKLDPLQEVKVQITDEQSGVDASSIEYRITTQGLTKWSQWMPYKDATDGPKPVVTLREYFRRGDDNYVQVRAHDLAGNPLVPSKAFNIKINTYPVIDVVSPEAGDELYSDRDIMFDASPSYDPDGDRLEVNWYISTTDGHELLGDSIQLLARLDPGEYTVTVLAKDRVNNEVQYHYTITVLEPEKDDADGMGDTDLDGLPDWWEELWQTQIETKDAREDPDGDGFTNLQEFENDTNPKNPRSHPPVEESVRDEGDLSVFDAEAWPFWVLLVVLLLAVLVTMVIVKSKKDRAVKRIKTVKNMRRIMPSVSWDEITTTAYMAPMTQGAALPASAGPALPSSQPAEMDQSSALPPAQDGAHEAAHTMQQSEGVPPSAGSAPETPPSEPAPQPAPAEPEPAPQPQQEMQSAPAGTVPAPDQPQTQNNLPPQ